KKPMKRKFFSEEELAANRNYKFSEKDIKSLQTLNRKLRQEELRFLALHDQLKPFLTAVCAQREIDDFNYHMKLSVFSKNEKCNALHDVFNGDPIWEDKTWSLFTDEDSREILKDNWNEIQDET